MSLRARLDRLERGQADQRPWLCDLFVSAHSHPDSLTPAQIAQLEALFEESEVAHGRAMEEHPAGKVYRAELTRLGLAQPATLRGIDVIEECIRLVGLPGSGQLPCEQQEPSP